MEDCGVDNFCKETRVKTRPPRFAGLPGAAAGVAVSNPGESPFVLPEGVQKCPVFCRSCLRWVWFSLRRRKPMLSATSSRRAAASRLAVALPLVSLRVLPRLASRAALPRLASRLAPPPRAAAIRAMIATRAVVTVVTVLATSGKPSGIVAALLAVPAAANRLVSRAALPRLANLAAVALTKP